MTRLCPKCHQVAESTLVADAGGVEFRRCGACQGMATFRAQEPRGQIVVAGVAVATAEAAGELEARTMLEPKGWAEHFAKQV